MWSPQVTALMADHDLLVWDSRGHGSSDWGEPFALQSWVRDIDRVLDDQDVARAALTGLSMGGIQAMAYAIARPHRVSALVLANTWAQLTPEDLQRKLDNLPRTAEQIGLDAFAEVYTAGAFADPGSAGARNYRQSLATAPATCWPLAAWTAHPIPSEQVAQDKAYTVAAFGGLATHEWWLMIEDEPPLLHGIVKTDRLIVFGGASPAGRWHARRRGWRIRPKRRAGPGLRRGRRAAARRVSRHRHGLLQSSRRGPPRLAPLPKLRRCFAEASP